MESGFSHGRYITTSKRVGDYLNKLHFNSILLSLILLLPGCIDGNDDSNILGTEYKDPPLAPDFTLQNQDGELVSFADYEGKVIVAAFVYTTCPDVCLIISANLDYIHDNLGENAEDVVILSVTIDPARDTVDHLSEWTERMGYEWDHLTHENASIIENVWNTWNVVVDDDHIANSLPPEDEMLRFGVLNPDNTSFKMDNKCWNLPDGKCYLDFDDFANSSFESAEIYYNMEENKIGDWQANEEWSWELHNWDLDNERWVKINSQNLSSILINNDMHFAWVASNANISNLLPGIDCNNFGWVMGTGSSAHCMCDEGYERPDGDWLSCVIISFENETNTTQEIDPHAETLGEYEIGHSTSTYIIDKNMNKRVSYSGIHWDVEEFLIDVITLTNE